jgi:hypothetical protein
MDAMSYLELGVAVAIAVGAKREMDSFRAMFKDTLDKLTIAVTKLTDHQESTEAKQLEGAMDEVFEVLSEGKAKPKPAGFDVDRQG